jgi:mono/diheme cytochrome c family protein
MRWNRLVLTCALSVVAGRPGTVRAQETAPGPAGELAAGARAVFSARCTGCHGPNLPRPRGRFGYVLDLARVAGNPEMVIPSSPEESELWQLVRRDEMPPPDAPSGALTAAEKEAIRAWIAAGAPAGDVSLQAEPSRGRDTEGPATSPALRALRWLGKFHLLVLHFPIALLLAAALAEAWAAWQGTHTPLPAVRLCTLLGAGGALAAAALGWLHAHFGGHGAGSPRALGLHRWLGTAAALGALAAALLWERDARRRRRGTLCRLTLWVSAALVAATAHFGGTLVHGDNFFDW